MPCSPRALLLVPLLCATTLALGACADLSGDAAGSDAAGFTDGGGGLQACDDPTADWDGDGILDGEEGCTFQRDSDGDGVPDWQDFDSDGDGVTDEVERGPRTAQGACAVQGAGPGWPCDSDGDGFADYLDVDADGDGVDDGDEDRDGDGEIGCCVRACGAPAGRQAAACALTRPGDLLPGGATVLKGEEGCGPGQRCVAGACAPLVGLRCSDGETDRLRIDTFADGTQDSDRGTFVCRDATEDSPVGRQPVETHVSQAGDWHVALPRGATYGELALAAAEDKEAAALIDVRDPQTRVAGFVLSLPAGERGVQHDLTVVLQAIQANAPGGSGAVTVRASGAQGKSHDGYDTVQGTILDVNLALPVDLSRVRDDLIATLLKRPVAALGHTPMAFGASHQQFAIRLVTVRRFAFARDPQTGGAARDAHGEPIDSGDASKRRLLVMGAVAARDDYQDLSRATASVMDGISDGTSLATSSDTVEDECDVRVIDDVPKADIVWVIDESGSMADNRESIVANADAFFKRAMASGLDFRMGITGVVAPTSTEHAGAVGKLCSRASDDDDDDGGEDRFLAAAEQAAFSACVRNPPGYEGGSEFGLVNAGAVVTQHLPRAAGDPSRFRPGAKVALIVATDEIPNSLGGLLGYGDYMACALATPVQQGVNAAVKKYLELFSGATDPEAAASFHVIGGVCGNTCDAQVAHGYRELAQALGGQIADVCQQDLGATLQVIIDSIAAEASPVTLDRVPISSSIAVAVNDRQLQRSRTDGFEYRGAKNAIVLINVGYRVGTEVAVSYKRWSRQVGIR